MALACGLVWGIVAGFVPFFYLNLLLAAGAGYAIGEVSSLSVNRKRGTGLAIIAGIAVVISYLVHLATSVLFLGSFPLGMFKIIFDLIAIALGVFVAVTRLR